MVVSRKEQRSQEETDQAALDLAIVPKRRRQIDESNGDPARLELTQCRCITGNSIPCNLIIDVLELRRTASLERGKIIYVILQEMTQPDELFLLFLSPNDWCRMSLLRSIKSCMQ